MTFLPCRLDVGWLHQRKMLLFPLWFLQFHSLWLSSCLSLSGEPDMKSCVALVTDSMWIPKCLWQFFFVNTARWSCAKCYHRMKHTSPDCHVHLHSYTKPGFSVRGRLHNGNPTYVFEREVCIYTYWICLELSWICSICYLTLAWITDGLLWIGFMLSLNSWGTALFGS